MNRPRQLILLLFLLICGLSGMAQTNVVSVDMFGLLHGRKGISYERSFKTKFSTRLSYENQRYSYGETNGQTVYQVRGEGVIPELRFYPFFNKKPAPLGFYFGPSLRYIRVTESYTPTNIKLSGTVFNYTIISGYKFNLDRLVFDLLAGYGSGQVSGLDGKRRSKIDPFYSDDTIDDLKGNFRFEISMGFYFPKLSSE